ncbi:hypothetical protein FGD71_044485 [Streptomyces sporangiiformans]|uniref:Uncharacterized protein n=1 Tax=Streptomyces sporangiiformans TaxID=2315329 RepID=A0A505CV12_9ACTN|nr:hypothetical protein FGD71_044485 [Streptomyces sporangiiformans]
MAGRTGWAGRAGRIERMERIGRVQRIGRMGRWGLALGGGVLWWWGATRLAFTADAGVLEGAVMAGGWGLSLLPVHCAPKARVGREAGVQGWGRGSGRGGSVSESSH